VKRKRQDCVKFAFEVVEGYGGTVDCDVVILGAGAAGLACARSLLTAGRTIVVLEAQSRVGGRLLTREGPGVPIELGGEFVHGPAAVSFELLRAADTAAIDVDGTSFAFRDGTLSEAEDPFEVASSVFARARNLRADVSVAEFLSTFDERERVFTRMLVEGFDAAEPARASILALADEWRDGVGGQTARQFRPLGGYAPLLRTLRAALDPQRARLLLDCTVRSVHRDGNGVDVTAADGAGAVLQVHAQAAIVTFSVGVLQAGVPVFDPPLPAATAAALALLAMGPVVKLALTFRSAFWETVAGGRYRDGAFFHRVEAAFPSFWTQLPVRAPLLIAWAGGPKAEALRAFDDSARVRTALDDLHTLFGDESDPHGEFESADQHDWQRDPYACGAYSYALVGGAHAREALASPVDDRLFFAGEASASAAESGTVAGALQSGQRAAAQVLARYGVSG
jgi:monoamine oxidase